MCDNTLARDSTCAGSMAMRSAGPARGESYLPDPVDVGYTWAVTANQSITDLPIRLRDIWLPPNLISVSRILITPLVGYFLARNDSRATAVCVALLALIGTTDFLDGYVARRLNLRSGLGLVLDPLADKLFAAVLLVELVLFRNFPIWLAIMIVGRDLLIVIAGMLVIRHWNIRTPSYIVGQYAFFSVILLLGFYVIRFNFGIELITPISVALMVLSLISYGRRFARILRNQPVTPPTDRPVYKILRVTLTVVILAICVTMLIVEKWLS
ncbi:hypothetical protein C3F09_12190 [candidate division GN15 bacterium]|uniref:CDP-alcohol phosphatidyltransferase family protein n=1 Tax=candidate division GN15 bacterium TaxID=2072418 RepID=A0A855WU97_9BACT|nr:MAG: hypothetical protein C3F09_12190 [candidate division GN15 bacterium]